LQFLLIFIIIIKIVANPDPDDFTHLPGLKWMHSLWAGVERLIQEMPTSIPIVRMVDPEMGRNMVKKEKRKEKREVGRTGD
jgi:glyoxylate/hydroxypyruvate reductase A